MKKLLLSIFIIGTSVYSYSQAPTRDFETWTTSGSTEDPTGWFSANVMSPLGNPPSVSKVTGAEAHGGTYAMKILSVTLTNTLGAPIPNPVGLAATGKVNGNQFKIGFPYTSRPTSIDFWYHYLPVSSGDTAACFVYLWNGVSKDTIGAALWKTPTQTSVYTSHSLPITYNSALSGVTPDSMAIVFSSTRLFKSDTTFCTNCGKAGSTLYVDDLAFVGTNGIDENPSSNGVTLYPNPASDRVTITVDGSHAVSARVYDATGRAVAVSTELTQTSVLNRRTGTITTSSLASGLYSYSVIDKSGNVINTGKFNVVK